MKAKHDEPKASTKPHLQGRDYHSAKEKELRTVKEGPRPPQGQQARQMTQYFGKVRGGGTFHLEDEEGISLQFCVGYHGEDENLLIEAFWKEQDSSGAFLVAPIIAFGKAPRAALSTPASLRRALETTKVSPDSRDGQQWAITCKRHNVAWPPRLKPRGVEPPKAA